MNHSQLLQELLLEQFGRPVPERHGVPHLPVVVDELTAARRRAELDEESGQLSFDELGLGAVS